MTDLSLRIVREYLVRRKASQKADFRKMLATELAEMGFETREEHYKDRHRSVNVIVGDVERAKLIFGAHYDTCRLELMPQLVTPLNRLTFIGYPVLCALVYLAIAALIALPLAGFVEYGAALLLTYGLVSVARVFMPPNPNTYNDNTSGVLSLLELMAAMTKEEREASAFVFMDNEERGLGGSSEFMKKYEKCLKDKAYINVDCIGDGNHLLLSPTLEFREDGKLFAALREGFDKWGQVVYEKGEDALYLSDQKTFPKSVDLATYHKGRWIGYYMGRIHSLRDVVLLWDNVERTVHCLRQMTGIYLK